MSGAATEAQFREWLRALCKRIGARLYFTYRSERSPAGWPDVQIVSRGRLFIAELKRDRGPREGTSHAAPTPDQRGWLDSLASVDRPPVVALWRPLDLEAISAALIDRDKPTPGLWGPGVGREDEGAG